LEGPPVLDLGGQFAEQALGAPGGLRGPIDPQFLASSADRDPEGILDLL